MMPFHFTFELFFLSQQIVKRVLKIPFEAYCFQMTSLLHLIKYGRTVVQSKHFFKTDPRHYNRTLRNCLMLVLRLVTKPWSRQGCKIKLLPLHAPVKAEVLTDPECQPPHLLYANPAVIFLCCDSTFFQM